MVEEKELNEVMYPILRSSYEDWVKYCDNTKQTMYILMGIISVFVVSSVLFYGWLNIFLSIMMIFPYIKIKHYNKKIIETINEIMKKDKENNYDSYDLRHCKKCNQMTNHIGRFCCKCGNKFKGRLEI